jgi:hypothetical protein
MGEMTAQTFGGKPINTMAILDGTGDTKVIWDPHNPDEVEAARAQFDALRKKGFLAYTVNKKGDKGEVITKFDPDAEKIILSPPLVGG